MLFLFFFSSGVASTSPGFEYSGLAACSQQCVESGTEANDEAGRGTLGKKHILSCCIKIPILFFEREKEDTK